MSIYQLTNDFLTLEVSSAGAELCSITGADGTEYMWNADPKYWKRHSPVLFPVVGNFNQKQFLYNGEKWPMGQHGFARDMEFDLIHQGCESLSFILNSNDETRKLYPMEFSLRISYTLRENEILTEWQVMNPGKEELHFSIGAHPAFYCPLAGNGAQADYSIDLHTDASKLTCGVLTSEGVLSEEQVVYPLENGRLQLTEHLFDRDALIVEGDNIHKLSLCLPNRKPYITMDFDAPLFGIWSPAGKQAPFVCLEPWYGRADRASFHDDVSKREYGTTLKPSETFQASYSMRFFPVNSSAK
ncbi:MAG: aldose 1-epimerase family protein [Lachnospiraceae bacterium]|nr:aldose 1-epimerase family protein [Lachnospiraceae bacterium]